MKFELVNYKILNLRDAVINNLVYYRSSNCSSCSSGLDYDDRSRKSIRKVYLLVEIINYFKPNFLSINV